MRFPNRLVAVGESQRRSIAETYNIAVERLALIRNGVPDVKTESSTEDQDSVRRGAEIVIGSISTLIPQKGIDVLLRAIRILADEALRFRVVLVGDGYLRSSLESLAKELDLNAYVEFVGWVDDAARRVLPWVDVFVQSSLWEAMSIVILEAMSSGCAIVATTVGDNSYIIRDAESGLLVPPGSPDMLAASLRKVITDRSLREHLARESRNDYEKKYTARRMCADYEELYLEILGQ